MSRIIAFAGSNSSASINKQLVSHVAGRIVGVDATILDLNDFELPLYGIDLERSEGIPENAQRFLDHIRASDGVLVSLAEHNGAYSTAFKNLFDWMSRIDGKLWSNKPMFLMAAAPGGRGGAGVLEIARGRFPRMGADLIAEFSLPFFGQNFSEEGISDPDLSRALDDAIETFSKAIN